MNTLESTGLFNSPEELIDRVFSLKAKDAHPRAIKRMCGISILTISKILKEYEPSIAVKIEMLEVKISKGKAAGQNMDHLDEDMKELIRDKKSAKIKETSLKNNKLDKKKITNKS